MIVGVLKESIKSETRVASTPEAVGRIISLGFTVYIEKGAGKLSGFRDQEYVNVGARIISGKSKLIESSEIILCVRELKTHDSAAAQYQNKTIIGLFWPAQNPDQVQQFAKANATVLAMDCVPRISRAQKLDVLSSMANVAGYRAVIEASHEIGRFLGGQMTAAGKIPPAIVLVIGAGVAGLAAIGAASNMGAVVRAFDTRLEVKEQVESLNATFLMLDFDEGSSSSDGYAQTMSDAFIEAEMTLFAEQAMEVDIIITTALIPGKKAPILITQDMVNSMPAGSVIVDMAAEQGGNCAYTVAGKKTIVNGVAVLGYTDLASRMAGQASQLYATNVVNLLDSITPNKDGQVQLDMDDEMIRGLTVINQGEVMWPPPPIKVSAALKKAELDQDSIIANAIPTAKKQKYWTLSGSWLAGMLLLVAGAYAPADFMAHFIVFVLACFVGWQTVWNVTPALHTPLMSVTNAISGIIVLGALLQINSPSNLAVWLASTAIVLASINIAGGFLVTRRMLRMFQK